MTESHPSPQATPDPNQENSFQTIPLKQISLRKLRLAMVARFSLEELDTLIFDLGLDPDEISGDTKSARVRSLLQLIQRRGWLRQLLIAIKRARPQIALAEIQKDSDTTSLDISTESQIAQAEQSLRTVQEHLSEPSVRAATIAFGNDLQIIQTELLRLYSLKRLHDLFQTLEFQYSLLNNDQNRLEGQELWDNIFLTEPEIQGILDDLVAAASHHSLTPAEVRWTQQVTLVQENFRTAVEHTDEAPFKTGMVALTRLLHRQPTRINVQLVTAARSLRLDKLAGVMTTISDALATSPEHTEDVPKLQNGIRALIDIEDRVVALAARHDAWQELDDELRQVEVSLGHDLADIENAWFFLRQLGENLFFTQTEAWALELTGLIKQLDTALTDRLVVNFRRLFRRFNTLANRRFYAVDRQLLALGQELQHVGESLNELVRKI